MKNILKITFIKIFFLSTIFLNFNFLFTSCNLCQEEGRQLLNICPQLCIGGLCCEFCVDRLYLDEKRCPGCCNDLADVSCFNIPMCGFQRLLENIDMSLFISGTLAWENFIKICCTRGINLNKLINNLNKAGYNIYCCDSLGNNILHAACLAYSKCQEESIYAFIEFSLTLKFDLNLLNAKGETVLDIANQACEQNFESDSYVLIINKEGSLSDLLKSKGAKKADELSVVIKPSEYDDLDPMLKIINYLIK